MKRAPDRRGEWTARLVLVGGILLASIEIGRMLGFRILAKAVEQSPVLPSVQYTARPQTTLPPVVVRNWKTEQVVRIAPDPHFPDPHITAPPPPPSPTPTPRRAHGGLFRFLHPRAAPTVDTGGTPGATEGSQPGDQGILVTPPPSTSNVPGSGGP